MIRIEQVMRNPVILKLVMDAEKARVAYETTPSDFTRNRYSTKRKLATEAIAFLYQ